MTALIDRLKPFPPRLIHENPSGGGSYVKHSVIVQRLLALFGSYDFEVVEILRGHVDAVKPNPNGKSQKSPHNWPHDGARMKDATSDAIKRCAARLGIGLHLWAQGESYLYEQLRAAEIDKEPTP